MNPSLSEALARLPHGPEFRFLDRLLSLEPGASGVGEYSMHGDEPFLHGHFPHNPMMPGVLLLEAAAQLAGTVAQSDPQIPPLPGLKLTAIRAAKITGTARPGETIRLEARVLGRMGNLVQAQATASVGGEIILQCELTLSGDAPAR
jgi:3-hydroxyacyl-[acyl-carrier-protein] dehydratase